MKEIKIRATQTFELEILGEKGGPIITIGSQGTAIRHDFNGKHHYQCEMPCGSDYIMFDMKEESFNRFMCEVKKDDNDIRITKVLKEIEEIKKPFLFWLKENDKEFPESCMLASEILSSYLQVKYGVSEVLVGTYDSVDNFHVWINLDDSIIDFTLFQFYLFNLEEDKKCMLTLDEEQLWEMIKKLQNDVIIRDSSTLCSYDIDGFIDPRFKKIVKDDFFLYLQEVKSSTIFKEFYYNNHHYFM